MYRSIRWLAVAVMVMASATSLWSPASGQDDNAAPDGITLAAGGLVNPRGMTWDDDGQLYVAQAGYGAAMDHDPAPNVVRIVDQCPVPVASGLPSTGGMGGNAQGATALAWFASTLYVLQDASGPFVDIDPNRPNGVYAVTSEGGVRLVADITTWIDENPVAYLPPDQQQLGEPFGMVAGPDGLFVVEANSGQVLLVTPNGTITRVADLSQGHPVPTAIALGPDGALYVGFLTAAPYPDGASKIVRIGYAGETTDVWTGLTMVTGLAIGPDGTLFATEMATGNTTTPPFIAPGTGQVVRQTGPDSKAVVTGGLDFPIAISTGPDGALYVSLPASGASDTVGGVLRIDPAAGDGQTLPETFPDPAGCAAPRRAAPAPSPVAMDGMAMAATPAPAAIGTETPATEESVSVIATGLSSPRSMTWDENGTLLVAQAGTGDSETSVGRAASVVRIVDGCPVPVASGLPSSQDPFKDVMGPEDLTIKNGRIFVLQGATGLLDSWPPQWPNGIYQVRNDGSLDLFANLTDWLNANPVEHPPGDENELGEPFRILADEGGFWVLESNRGELLWATDTGEISRVAEFSEVHEVWTSLAPAPDGGVYIGTLTPAPHIDGTSRVFHVSRDGKIENVWTGLVTVTGLVVADDGTLYALEMATDNESGMRPRTGRIVRQTGPSSLEVVATGLDLPIAMKQGPDGGLYVAMPAYGDNDLAGVILRIDPDAAPVAVDMDILAGARCRGAPSYAPPDVPAPAAIPAADAAATPAATPVAMAARIGDI